MTPARLDLAADIAAYTGGVLIALSILDTLLSAVARTLGG